MSRFRELPQAKLEGEGGEAGALRWLRVELGLGESAAAQVVAYALAQLAGSACCPRNRRIALERFFDESGGTQLVIHSPYGSRINKAWGLALRKRFCRKFNFELQAAATEDAIVLSLDQPQLPADRGDELPLHSSSAEQVLVQALLDAPLFPARFRWNATNALALPRFSGGRKVAPQLQRMKSEDLMATVFPDQVACLRTSSANARCPTIRWSRRPCGIACTRRWTWMAGWRCCALEAGEVEVVARDLTSPSPFAAEVLGARPYAFLDDAPLEERRTRAVQTRGFHATQAEDLGRLDPGAIEGAREMPGRNRAMPTRCTRR